MSSPGFSGLSGSIFIESYVPQCKIDLLKGEIGCARGKQVGEKFNVVSSEEYCIAMYGLKQASFNLISLVQVYQVRCLSVSCVVLLETHRIQCVKLHLNLGQHFLKEKDFFSFGLPDTLLLTCICPLFFCILYNLLLSPWIHWKFSIIKTLH